MTIERMCTMIQAEPDDCRELLPILWEKVRRLLFKIAGDYYAQHVETCTRCGVEAGDLRGICYDVFLSAVDAYKPDGDASFTSYFNYTFKNQAAELLGIRTERGRREPLNNCDSLDRPIDAEDTDGATLGDFVGDPAAAFVDNLLEGLNREQEAAEVRAAVERLPEQLRQVIQWHFLEGQTLSGIGERLGVSLEWVRQLKNKGLKRLRCDRRLRLVYLGTMTDTATAEADARRPGMLDRIRAKADNPTLHIYTTSEAKKAIALERILSDRESLTTYLAEDSPEQRAADYLLTMV